MADWSRVSLGMAFSWLILRASIGGIQTNLGEMVKGVRRCGILSEYMLLTHVRRPGAILQMWLAVHVLAFAVSRSFGLLSLPKGWCRRLLSLFL